MDTQEQIQVTVEFDLPIGYEDKDGGIHKHVVMRRVKAVDIKSLRKDLEIRDLTKEQLDVSGGNPAIGMISVSALMTVYGVLFARVVTQLGDIPKDKINRAIFEEMYQKDIFFMINKYNELNDLDMNVNLEELAKKGDNVPFGQ